MCAMGLNPNTLKVVPIPTRVNVCGKPAINMMDHQPIMNVPSFGMCKNPQNPAVATLTAAAAGVLTPAPCIPMTQAPITNVNPTVLLNQYGAAHINSKIMCMYGIISITAPPQKTVFI